MLLLHLTAELKALLGRIRDLASSALTLDALEKEIAAAMAGQISYYDWTGFYWLDPDDPETLVLGAFVGESTPHTRIPITQGICGSAIALGETVVVDDVNADPRYLSCSLQTKSEIVVPIFAGDKIVGEIDIDSHTAAAFSEIDRIFLQEVARAVGLYIEKRTVKTV
jgi:GAF domain-containing protein